MTVHINVHMNYTRELLKNILSKMCRHEVNFLKKKSVALLCTNDKMAEKVIREAAHF